MRRQSPLPPRPVWARHSAFARQAELSAILAEISREALQGEDLAAVLQAICDCLVRRLPVTIASIILLSEDGSCFVQEVWAGDLDLDQPGVMPWPVTVGAAGRCARSGQAQLIADVHADPDYVPGNHAVQAEYLVPIRHRQRLHGVLNIESTEADFFTAEARAVFDAIAIQVAGAIHLARLARELEVANRRLEALSMQDGLTGIANRRCFDLRLEEAWGEAGKNGSPLALALVDADGFKRLNDRHGHLHGDECLRALAAIGQASLRHPDELIARYGGEELALLLPGLDGARARARAESLRRRIEQARLRHDDAPVGNCLTVSIGVAAGFPGRMESPRVLIAIADRALYRAKRGGRNRVVRAAEAGRSHRSRQS